MPLTKTGKELLDKYKKQYGSKEKGERIFYSQENKGSLTKKAFAKRHK